jgi:D-alanyl-D-alanine carboxypeptidase
MRTFRIRMAAAVAGSAALAICAHAPSPAAGRAVFANATSPTSVAAKKPTRLQKIVRGLVAAHAPGALAFVRTPTRVRSAAAGAARLQPRVPMRAVDRYRIASVTKTFVATIVLQLAGEGKLGVDDSVERWLPGVVPNGAAITLRHLLSHTSGLFNYTDDQGLENAILADPGREWSPRELLAVAFTHEPLFAPGANWSYSNTNYVLLGLVIEAVTGKKVDQELRERLFEPLALRSTSFPTGLSVEEPFAHGYFGLPGGALIDLTSVLSPSWSYAAGQIVSTAADVTTFFAALLKGRLLPAPLLTQMKTGSAVSAVYGLGLRTISTPCGRAFGHDGDFFAWHNVVWSTAKGRRVAVVMVNIDTAHVPWSRVEAAGISALCYG